MSINLTRRNVNAGVVGEPVSNESSLRSKAADANIAAIVIAQDMTLTANLTITGPKKIYCRPGVYLNVDTFQVVFGATAGGSRLELNLRSASSAVAVFSGASEDVEFNLVLGGDATEPFQRPLAAVADDHMGAFGAISLRNVTLLAEIIMAGDGLDLEIRQVVAALTGLTSANPFVRLESFSAAGRARVAIPHLSATGLTGNGVQLTRCDVDLGEIDWTANSAAAITALDLRTCNGGFGAAVATNTNAGGAADARAVNIESGCRLALGSMTSTVTGGTRVIFRVNGDDNTFYGGQEDTNDAAAVTSLLLTATADRNQFFGTRLGNAGAGASTFTCTAGATGLRMTHCFLTSNAASIFTVNAAVSSFSECSFTGATFDLVLAGADSKVTACSSDGDIDLGAAGCSAVDNNCVVLTTGAFADLRVAANLVTTLTGNAGATGTAAGNVVTGVTTFGGLTNLVGAATISNVIADPGTGNPIPVANSGTVMITTAAAETNTLAIPTFQGQILTLYVDTYAVGDRVITCAQALNAAGNTIITLNAARDFVTLVGVTVGGALRWEAQVVGGTAALS